MTTWKCIPSLPGYEVTAFGRVRSWRSNGGRKRTKPRVLRQYTSAGYRFVYLSPKIGGRRTTFLVHRLVLEAFVGPCPVGMEACHGDGVRTHNRLDNLRWDTRRANAQERVRHQRLRLAEAA